MRYIASANTHCVIAFVINPSAYGDFSNRFLYDRMSVTGVVDALWSGSGLSLPPRNSVTHLPVLDANILKSSLCWLDKRTKRLLKQIKDANKVSRG